MTWDYIIIGAGSAGCALAHPLVLAGKSVLVLEAGGKDRSPFVRVASTQPQACARYDWGYYSEPDSSRNGAFERWTRGRVLGGCSSINGTMYTRGAPIDFDRWNIPGWSWADVLPLFQAFERSDQSGSDRGHDGQLHIRTVRRPHPITRAFVRSAEAMGLPFHQDINSGEQEGVGYAQLTQRGGYRWSAADAFLKPILGRSNLKLELGVQVMRINFAGTRAESVTIRRGNDVRTIKGDQIVLCAGAINSPQLLMLSGVGDPAELAAVGIEANIESRSVGRNLLEQPMISLVYRMKSQTYNLTGGWRQKLSIAAQFLMTGEGPVSNLFEGAAFVRSSPRETTPDLQLLFLPFGYVKDEGGRSKLTPYPAVTVIGMLSYPRSAGSIKLISADPTHAPRIDCRLLGDPHEVEAVSGCISQIRRIMAHAPIADLVETEVKPGPSVVSADELAAYVRDNTTISLHPLGTCRMGTDPHSVVDPELRVRGTENLWVADASIIPMHLSANLNAVCIMIGQKLGRQFLSAARPKTLANEYPTTVSHDI